MCDRALARRALVLLAASVHAWNDRRPYVLQPAGVGSERAVEDRAYLLSGAPNASGAAAPRASVASWLAATSLPPKPVVERLRITAVMMTYQRGRVQDALTIIERYSALPDVFLEIVLIWNEPRSHPLSDAADPLSQRFGRIQSEPRSASRSPLARFVELTLLEPPVNSMNNRFAVWPHVSTRGVLIQDDDMWMEPDQLRCLHAEYVRDPVGLLGAHVERTDFFAHAATRALTEITPSCVYSDDGRTECEFPWGGAFAFLLPHPWLSDRAHLAEYMAIGELTRLVDDMHNCDDMLYNAVVANASRRPPRAVDLVVRRRPTWKSHTAMWVADADWKLHRTQCLTEIQRYFAARGPTRGCVPMRHDVAQPTARGFSAIGVKGRVGLPEQVEEAALADRTVWRRTSDVTRCAR